MCVRDFAASAHGLLTERYTPLPGRRRHERIAGFDSKDVGPGLFGTTRPEPKVGEAKRHFKPAAPAEKLRQAVVQQNPTIAVAENIDDPVQALKLIQGGLDKLPDEHAAVTAFAIAGRY